MGLRWCRAVDQRTTPVAPLPTIVPNGFRLSRRSDVPSSSTSDVSPFPRAPFSPVSNALRAASSRANDSHCSCGFFCAWSAASSPSRVPNFSSASFSAPDAVWGHIQVHYVESPILSNERTFASSC